MSINPHRLAAVRKAGVVLLAAATLSLAGSQPFGVSPALAIMHFHPAMHPRPALHPHPHPGPHPHPRPYPPHPGPHPHPHPYPHPYPHFPWVPGALVWGAAVADSVWNEMYAHVIYVLPGSCAIVTVHGQRYAECGSLWYQRVTHEGTIAYVQVPDPR